MRSSQSPVFIARVSPWGCRSGNRNRGAGIQNNYVKNCRSTYRVDLFASRLKQLTLSLHGYSAIFIKKGRIFQKESTLSGNSYYEQEKGRPPNSPGKGVDSHKVSVSTPNPPKLCLWILLKRVDSLPHFFVLNTGSGSVTCLQYS
jgi:hypothetical protein